MLWSKWMVHEKWSLPWRDSNPQPFSHESPALITRPRRLAYHWQIIRWCEYRIQVSLFRWNRKFRYLEDMNSKLLEKNREAQAKLIPRGDWVANEDDKSKSQEEEQAEEASLIAFAKSILLKSKNYVMSVIENKWVFFKFLILSFNF